MTTIAEKLSALKEHYGSLQELADRLSDWDIYYIRDWLYRGYPPSNGAQDAINRLYDELKEGE